MNKEINPYANREVDYEHIITNQRSKIKKLTEKEVNTDILAKIIGRGNIDDRFDFKRDPSGASCYVKDIKSFSFGGFSSRFWLYRKHINSMEHKDLRNLPFYCWECITLSTDDRDVNIVIKNEKDMKIFLCSPLAPEIIAVSARFSRPLWTGNPRIMSE